jgi:hypothetical protein
MSKWCSYGYGPYHDPEARRTRDVEDELVRKYLPVILAHANQILQTPRYFFCQIEAAFMSSLWMFGGGGSIPLGVLFLLWGERKMLYDCPTCGFRLRAVGLSGSFFQTIGTVWGFCEGCGQRQTIPLAPCHNDMMAVGELLRIHRNEPVIQKGKRPVFDWEEGLKGEFTPDRVIIPAVEPVNIGTLIVELRGSAFMDSRGEGELLQELGLSKQLTQPIRRGFRYPIPLETKRR